MNDAERPDEELGTRLLEAYREQVSPPSAASGRVWRAMDETLAAGAGTGAAAGSAATGGAALLTPAKLGLLLVAALAVGGGGLWLSSSGPGTPPAPNDTAAAVPATSKRPSSSQSPVPAPGHAPSIASTREQGQEDGAATSDAPEPSLRPRAAERPATAATGRSEHQGPSSLAEELRLLSAARTARAEGRPRQALALLRRHRRRHPEGVMSEEREADRVALLCQLGHLDEARRVARAFARRFSGSPLLAQVRGACEEGQP